MDELRRIARRVPTPPPAPGFAGPGHTAVEVLAPHELQHSDPFVLLMDDRIDFAPGRQIGGAHPHAGIETVTLLLSGSIADRDEGRLSAGDAVWMTAGRGIIHNEDVVVHEPTCVLQLWIGLPTRARAAAPAVQILSRDTIPIRREPGVEAHLYSGSTGELRSSTRNLVPVSLVDFTLAAGSTVDQVLPASYGGFLYVLSGALRIGQERLAAGEVGWLDRRTGDAATTLRLEAETQGSRVVLYAGQPHGEPLLQHGPFVASSRAELADMFAAFREGQFASASRIAAGAAR